jgi:hypothetical protein
MQLRRFTVDGKLFQAARRETNPELKSIMLSAARTIRAHRLAAADTLKAAGLPTTAKVEFFVGVVGHDTKPPEDVRELERVYGLQDPRG